MSRIKPLFAVALLLLSLLVAACGPGSRAELRPRQPLDASPADAFRRQAPPPLAMPERGSVAVEPLHATLDNGLQLFVIPRPRFPLMTVTYVNRAAAFHGAGRPPGLAVVTGDALRTGGTSIENGDVLFDMEIGGQKPAVYTSFSSTQVSFTLPPSALKVVTAMLGRIVRYPTFEAAGVQKAQLMHVRWLYDRGFTGDGYLEALAMAQLYGKDHPWAVDHLEEGKAVAALTRDDIAAYHAEVYRPSVSAIVVSGAVDPEKVEAHVRRAFGDWVEPAEPLDPRTLEFNAQPHYRSQISAVLVGGEESELKVMQPSVAIGHRDAHALRILAHVFGGGFTSRATLRLRHDEGIAYSVRAGAGLHADGGTFWIRTSVANDRVEQAARALVEETVRLQTTPISTGELAAAKAQYRASVDLSNTAADAYFFATAFAAGLGPDAHRRTFEQLEAVTVQDVQRVAAAYLSDKPNFFVLTNYRQTFRQLERLGAVRYFERKRP
ncbi:MAG: insulinase family protein [Myxococcales bacterium]|nr:insulinase family protein [Myxococcales bacterium]